MKTTVAGVTSQAADADNPSLLLNSDGSLATGSGTSASQVQGTAADGAAAVGKPVQMGGVDGSGNVQALATDTSGNLQVVGSVASGSADSGNPVKVGAKYNSTQPTFTDGQRADLQVGARGSLRVEMFQPGGVNALAWGGSANGTADQNTAFIQVLPYVRNGATWDMATKSNSTSRLLTSAATTNSTNVKASAGNLHKIIVNVAVAGKFLKLYNKATAPTVGTDTPVMTIPLPTTGLVQLDFGQSGHYFSAGIGFGITGAAADADTTAVASGDLTGINFIYS